MGFLVSACKVVWSAHLGRFLKGIREWAGIIPCVLSGSVGVLLARILRQ